MIADDMDIGRGVLLKMVLLGETAEEVGALVLLIVLVFVSSDISAVLVTGREDIAAVSLTLGELLAGASDAAGVGLLDPAILVAGLAAESLASGVWAGRWVAGSGFISRTGGGG